MNRLLILLFSVACLSVTYHVSSTVAMPAVIVGATCNFYDAEGTGSIRIPGTEIDTDSNNNNLVETCNGVTTNLTGKAIHWDAFNVLNAPVPCMNSDGTNPRQTLDWHETISASGHVTATCHFKD